MRDSCNKRTDKWGGSFENRSRLLLLVIDELIEVFGNSRVGIKLSPLVTYQDMWDSDVVGLYTYLIGELNKRDIAFIEVNEGTAIGNDITPFIKENPPKPYDGRIGDLMKSLFKGTYIANFGYTFESGNKAIEDGQADLVSFGSLFVCNADLVKKFETGATLNGFQHIKDHSKIPAYLYMNGPIGYLDTSVYEPSE